MNRMLGGQPSRRRNEWIPATERREAVEITVGREQFPHAVSDAERRDASIVNGRPPHVPIEHLLTEDPPMVVRFSEQRE